MKKKVLLVNNDKSREHESFVERIQSVLGSKFKVDSVCLSDLVFDVNGEKTRVFDPERGLEVADFDLVVFRYIGGYFDEAHAVALFCRKLGIGCIDSYVGESETRDKLGDAMACFAADLLTPRTVYGPIERVVEKFEEVAGEFGKVIFKNSHGAKGRLNFLAESAGELRKIQEENPTKRFVMQEYIKNNGDLRVLVMGFKAKLVIERTAAVGSHLNSTSQGGSMRLAPLGEVSKEALRISERISKAKKLEVAGIDVIIEEGTSRTYVLEVNQGPQISSGGLLEEKAEVYAELLRALMKKGRRRRPRGRVGRSELVDLPGFELAGIPARIDTGAAVSSIWASGISETSKGLEFSFFDSSSEFYTGKRINVQSFSRRAVQSSTGTVEVRYMIRVPVVLKDRKIMASFTLANRSTQSYPVLIGRNVIKNKFIVDVAKGKAKDRYKVLRKKLDGMVD